MADPVQDGSQLPGNKNGEGGGAVQAPAKEGEGALSKNFMKYVKDFVVLAPLLLLIAGAFQYGVTIGRGQWEYYKTKAEDLEKQKKEVEGNLNQAREAQALLTRDLADCKRQLEQRGKSATSDAATQNRTAVTQILVGETAAIFNNQLSITVRAIAPFPAPPSYKVFAVLGSPGKESLPWEGFPGDRKTFAGAEILIQSVDAASAFFLVQKTAP